MSSASPRGGPRADVGEYGDFMGTLQQISALEVGKCGDFASVQLRGDWERSIDGKMAEEKFRTAYKGLQIVKDRKS